MIGALESYDADPRFADIGMRTQHISAIYAMVADKLRTRTTGEWLTLFDRADIPASPLNTLDSLSSDPHLAAVGYFVTAEHPSEGTIRQMGHAATWSESPPSTRCLAPRLGEHSVEVLRELGYDREQIAHMLASGVTMVPEL